MLTIYAENVNDAYDKAIIQMERIGVRSDSRNGGVTVAPHPVMTVYEKPWERVLFNRYRDANPFFHFFECIWMMAGMRDGRWLDRFVGDFSSRYGEPHLDNMIWGAYGHRWRFQFGVDQLNTVVNRLRKDPNDRRVVIQMWDAHSDLYNPNELDPETGQPHTEPRDVPCNTAVYLRIVNGALDMTVTCRSNDIVWGAYGANAVHFSFLQEYLAGRIGVKIGKYYQLSNNWHVYDGVSEKFKRDPITVYPRTVQIGNNWDHWDDDLGKFVHDPTNTSFMNVWFLWVARPMWETHRLWKEGRRTEALRMVEQVQAHDWRMATTEWMKRRISK